MKHKILILFFFVVGLILYFSWPSKDETPKLEVSLEKPEIIDSQKIPVEKKPISIKDQTPTIEKQVKIKGFSQIEKINYLKKIEDTIKDQGKELEDCESEFDLQFGELIAMGPDQQLEYLEDANNLDNFLDKISSFNMTTPSSAKMIKELAEPIANEVDGKEIINTVGFVKKCRDIEKSTILWILHNLKIKNQNTALAAIAFFENENSTLTYPGILYNKIYDIKTFLVDFGLKESDFPELVKITKDYEEYLMRQIEIDKNLSQKKETLFFNFIKQKNDYKYAIKLQQEIKLLLQKIKRNFI